MALTWAHVVMPQQSPLLRGPGQRITHPLPAWVPLKLRVGIVRLGSASPRAGCTIKHLVATPCTLLVNLASEKDQGASGSDATTASWLAPWSYPPPKLSTFHPQFLASSGRSNTRKASDGAPSSVLCRSYSTRPMRSGRSARP
jgi:hypothetical protein